MEILYLVHLGVMWVEAVGCLAGLGWVNLLRLKPGRERSESLTLPEITSGWVLGYVVSEPLLFAREFVDKDTAAWNWLSLASAGSLAALGATACTLSFSLLHSHMGAGYGLRIVDNYVYGASVVAVVAVVAGYGWNIDKSVGVGLGVYAIGRFAVGFFWVFQCTKDLYEVGKEEISRKVVAAAVGSILFFTSIVFSFLPLGWAMIPAVVWAIRDVDKESAALMGGDPNGDIKGTRA
mmetsp:Transcript_5696/g.11414  ORF Transcript_5696/g.11414 Transcript_5696/m.11414 type:complete len:236 (-) Transcript_5696:34-741(-)